MEHLSNDHKGHSNQNENSQSYTMKRGIPLGIRWKVNGNWDNHKIRISQWKESHCRTNTSVRRKKEIQKSRTMRITVWDPSRKFNHLSKVIWDRKITTVFTRSICSTRIGKPVPMMDVKVSKDKNISRWVDREKLIYIRRNRIKNLSTKTKMVINRGKTSKTLTEGKPVGNISENLQSFLDLSPMQKEVLL